MSQGQNPKKSSGLEITHAKKGEEGEGPWLVSYADLMTLLMGFFALIASFSKPDIKAFEEVKKSAVEQFGGQYKAPYEELEAKVVAAVNSQGVQDSVKVSRGADGVTIKFDGKTLFDSGEFVVKTQGAQIVHGIILAIQKDVHEYKAILEGHTDNVPISHNIIASNWELSALRAARIAQILEADGFQKEQLIIQGWGETKPEAANLDSAGQPIAENQAKNRRVIIKIYR